MSDDEHSERTDCWDKLSKLIKIMQILKESWDTAQCGVKTQPWDSRHSYRLLPDHSLTRQSTYAVWASTIIF